MQRNIWGIPYKNAIDRHQQNIDERLFLAVGPIGPFVKKAPR
ncbi:hypothetical protein [Mucilaginibacter phyllosphaerae]